MTYPAVRNYRWPATFNHNSNLIAQPLRQNNTSLAISLAGAAHLPKKKIQSGRFPSRSLSLSPLPSDQICLSLSVVPIIFVCLVHTIPISDVNQPEILIFWRFNPHSGTLNYRFRWINDDKSTFWLVKLPFWLVTSPHFDFQNLSSPNAPLAKASRPGTQHPSAWRQFQASHARPMLQHVSPRHDKIIQRYISGWFAN